MVEVPLRNSTPVALSVASVQLLDPRFVVRPAVPEVQTVRPGERIDFVVPYGDARCPAGAGTGRVLLTETTPGGVARTEIALPAPQPILDRIHDAACHRAALADAVTLELRAAGSARVADGAPELPVTLRAVRRRPGPAVVVADVAGSVLFGVRPGRSDRPAGSPLLTLDSGTQRADVPLVVRVLRCDPHGQTATKIFVWTVRAALGAEPPAVVELDVPPDLQPLLLRAQELC